MISAVIHTYNEEKNIERCISSLSWADEIIVVDMGSTDKTVTIASEYKAKIFDHPYTGFVEPARNFGIKKAKGDWILIVDADEEIPKMLADRILELAENNSADYCRIARKNIIFGKWIRHSGWWPDYQVRFFRKGCVSWSDKIHGVPLTQGNGLDLDPENDLCIVHYNYQTLEQFINRLNRYSSVSAKELFLANRRFSFRDVIQTCAKEFINRYLLWEGYKDGVHGLALAFLQAFSEVVTFLKLWELESFKEERVSLEEVRNEVSKSYKLEQYWFISVLLSQPQDFIRSLILRIRRKLTRYG